MCQKSEIAGRDTANNLNSSSWAENKSYAASFLGSYELLCTVCIRLSKGAIIHGKCALRT